MTVSSDKDLPFQETEQGTASNDAELLPPNGSWATMEDVARVVGVSKMTVSRALKDSALVSSKTKARIAAAASELGYVPNLAAISLSSGRSKIVAAVVPGLSNSQASQMLQGLGDRLAAYDCHLLVTVARGQTEDGVIAALAGRHPDGIVLNGAAHSEATANMLRSARIPVVETWDIDGPFIDSAVGFNGYKAAWDVVQMLIDRGYRSIGYADFADVQQPHRIARRRGFQAALAAAGRRSDLTAGVPVDSGFSGGAMVLASLLAREPGLVAVVCGSDVIAAGVIFECQRRGWNVPGRLAVTGFGDFEIARAIMPRITTVKTNAYRLGETAADIIAARRDGRGGAQVVDVGYQLVIRESC